MTYLKTSKQKPPSGSTSRLVGSLRVLGLRVTRAGIAREHPEHILHDAKIAFRVAIREHHVDHGGTAERTRELTEAWKTIKRILKR